MDGTRKLKESAVPTLLMTRSTPKPPIIVVKRRVLGDVTNEQDHNYHCHSLKNKVNHSGSIQHRVGQYEEFNSLILVQLIADSADSSNHNIYSCAGAIPTFCLFIRSGTYLSS